MGRLLAPLTAPVTPMGARLLHDWLLAPLAERPAIEARLDAVAELHDSHPLRQELRERLGEAFDLQRLTARVSTVGRPPATWPPSPGPAQFCPGSRPSSPPRAPLLAELERRLELCPDLRESLDAALATTARYRRKKAA